MLKIALIVLVVLLCQISFAGMDFSMLTAVPDFNSELEAIAFGMNYVGEKPMRDKVVSKIAKLMARIGELEGLGVVDDQDVLWVDYARQQIVYLQDALRVINYEPLSEEDQAQLGSVVYGGSLPIKGLPLEGKQSRALPVARQPKED